jgi:hypothetical protein
MLENVLIKELPRPKQVGRAFQGLSRAPTDGLPRKEGGIH